MFLAATVGKGIAVSIALLCTYQSYLYYQSQWITSSKKAHYAKQAQLKKDKLSNTKHACFADYKAIIKPEIESKILEMSATQIRENIIKNNISCVESVLVICYHTHQCNKALNAILEEHYDSAYHEALALDKLIHSKRTTSSKQEWNAFTNSKSLLGIPVSIKDLFIMKNSDCTNGLRRLCNQPHASDGAMLQLIRSEGGIPYVKTSCPQLNMLPESVNHIIGHTNNPYNAERVAGGSSGGEAALVACGASKLGVGSDIGGSLRMPANFCGCIAYKPPSTRSLQRGKGLAYGGEFVNKLGIRAAQGPMAMHMDDIIRFLKVMWSPKTLAMDPYMVPMPFREAIFSSKRKLRIGFWKVGDGWFTSTQCVQRAVTEVVNILQGECEYELVELPFADGFSVLRCYFGYMGAESNMKEYLRALEGTEELFHGFKEYLRLQAIVYYVKSIVHTLAKWIGEDRKAKLLSHFKGCDLSMREYKDMCKEMEKFKHTFWEWWDSFGDIDCVVCPTNFYPAPKHDFSSLRGSLETFTATFLQNVLDCSAGTYGPVTFVNKNECHYNLDDLPNNEKDSYSKAVHEYMKDAYGLPVGVQIFSKPYNDEIVLRVMNDLDKYYKSNRVKTPKLITDSK
eukprot:957280_1